MSHFTVAVITEGKPTYETIEKVLAPYQEDCPTEFMEFYSATKNHTEEYENETEDIKAKYPTLNKYLEEYCGYRYHEEQNDYGYWENPNAKWDWWIIGGRWAGLLTVSESNKNFIVGQPSLFGSNENPYQVKNGYMHVDCARVKDLVFPNREKSYEQAIRFWEMKVEGKEPTTEEEKELLKWDFYKVEYYTRTYKDKETYAQCESTFHTYAIIDKDGRWNAKGEMGWWGISTSDEGVEVQYIKYYRKYVFDNATDNDYITIVDCHI